MEFGTVYFRSGSDSPEEEACVGDHVEDIGIGDQLLEKFLLLVFTMKLTKSCIRIIWVGDNTAFCQ